MATAPNEIITRVGSIQGQVWQTVSSTVGEACSEPITFASAITVSTTPSDILAEFSAPVLSIQYTFADQPDHVQAIVMPQDTLLAFASLVLGRDVEEANENLIADIRPALEGIVQGICLAAGNIINVPVSVTGLNIRHQIFSFPSNLQRATELVRTQVAMSGEGFSGTLIWLMDTEAAAVLLGITVETNEENSVFETIQGGSVQTNKSSEECSLDMFMDIPLQISVELGRVRMNIKDIVDLGIGSIIEIEKGAGEPVDVLVNGRPVARGEVVVIDENFGVRITEIITSSERSNRQGEAA